MKNYYFEQRIVAGRPNDISVISINDLTEYQAKCLLCEFADSFSKILNAYNWGEKKFAEVEQAIIDGREIIRVLSIKDFNEKFPPNP